MTGGDARAAGRKAPIAVFISGRGSNLAALMAACRAPDFPARIALVLSDRPDAAGLGLAREAGHEALAIPRAHFSDREAFEAALTDACAKAKVERICLAGFMRILGPSFVAHWEGRILNIHPSLLPAFKGLDTHRRALEAGVKIHGATVHEVVAELDAGPIVAQAAVPVLKGDDADRLAERVLAAEHALYSAALARHITGASPPCEPGAALFVPPRETLPRSG